MSNRLPNVPPWIKGPAHDYLVSLVDAMDRELSQRRELQDGILYVAEEKPLHIISPNGVKYTLTVDDPGELVLEPAPQQTKVVGDGALVAAIAKLAGKDDAISGGVISGTNANGSWIIFPDKTMICWKRINAGNATFAGGGTYGNPYRSDIFTWTFPQEFADPPDIYGTVRNGSLASSESMVLNQDDVPTTTATSDMVVAKTGGGAGTQAAIVSISAIGYAP